MKFVLIETPKFYLSSARDEYSKNLTQYDADVRELIRTAY